MVLEAGTEVQGVGSIQTFFLGNDYRPFPREDDGRWMEDGTFQDRLWAGMIGLLSGEMNICSKCIIPYCSRLCGDLWLSKLELVKI